MTKWEMTNMLIDDNDTVWLPQDSRWLMRQTKSYLADLIEKLNNKDKYKNDIMFRWNARDYIEGEDKIEGFYNGLYKQFGFKRDYIE